MLNAKLMKSFDLGNQGKITVSFLETICDEAAEIIHHLLKIRFLYLEKIMALDLI